MSDTSTPDYKFEGWLGHSKADAEGNMQWGHFQPQAWDEDDIDVKIQYCGLCASDVHTLSEGWSKQDWPICVGHEIVGTVVRVGQKSGKKFKVGDLVGVGAQADSCMKCESCEAHSENYCPDVVTTYGGVCCRGNAKGDKTWGGYGNYHRARADFAFKIPNGLDPAFAAPLMCGGITVYNPLKLYGAGSPTARRVGVVGLGGLGHFAVLFAKAMGAEVTAISRGEGKKADAEAMGATRFIATGDDAAAAFAAHKRSLDLIICTANGNLPLAAYLALLRPGGYFVLVGAAEQALALEPLPLLFGGTHIAGSLVGPPAAIEEMLAFAASTGLKPWIEKRSLRKDANKAIVEQKAGKAKYRYVFVNEENGGKME
ncbi:hypothetical protein JCM6882_003000 [Rhodosporidiobolus microsporus]